MKRGSGPDTTFQPLRSLAGSITPSHTLTHVTLRTPIMAGSVDNSHVTSTTFNMLTTPQEYKYLTGGISTSQPEVKKYIRWDVPAWLCKLLCFTARDTLSWIYLTKGSLYFFHHRPFPFMWRDWWLFLSAALNHNYPPILSYCILLSQKAEASGHESTRPHQMDFYLF